MITPTDEKFKKNYISQEIIYVYTKSNDINLSTQTIKTKLIKNLENSKISNDDIVIYIENNIKNNNLLLWLVNSIQLYNCDLACTSSFGNDVLIYDNYNSVIDTTMPFACRYKNFKNIIDDKINSSSVTDYYKTNKLYACCINIPKSTTFIKIDDFESDNDYLPDVPKIYSNKILFRNVANLYHKYESGNYQIDIKYYNDTVFLGTMTYFGDVDLYNEDYIFCVGNIYYRIKIPYTYKKCSCFFEIDDKLVLQENLINKIELFQVIDNNHEINNFDDFYKFMTVATYNNSLTYKTYIDRDIDDYIKKEDSMVQKIYSYIESSSLKRMLFILLKLYNENCVYIDKNCIQYNNIDFKKSIVIRKKDNILEYTDQVLYITGEENKKCLAGNIKILLTRLTEKSSFEYAKMNNKKSLNLEIIEKYDLHMVIENENKLISNINDILFFSFCDNNVVNHYESDKKNKTLYKNLEFGNVYNGIDKIVWINLDKSEDRRINMENTLKKINIPSERISAVNGYANMDKYSNLDFNDNMDDREKACTLSHFKAFANLKKSKGKYFMICEDDATLSNILIYNVVIKDIIKNFPENLDILMIHSRTNGNMTSLNKTDIAIKKSISSACYIVTRDGIDKLLDVLEYIDKTDKFKTGDNFKKIGVADSYIFSLVKTYEYKHNLVSTYFSKSTIHNTDDDSNDKYGINKENYIAATNFAKTFFYINDYFKEKNKFIDGMSNYNEFMLKFFSEKGFNVFNKGNVTTFYRTEKKDYNKWEISQYDIEDNIIVDKKSFIYDGNLNNSNLNMSFVKKIVEQNYN